MLIHKMSYSSSDIRIERSIYFFYWLFKFARSVVVKSRSAFYISNHLQQTKRQIFWLYKPIEYHYLHR